MGLLPDPVIHDLLGVQRNMTAINNMLHAGEGDPNGRVVASPGALYLNTEGGAGTALWVKESGVEDDTGWVAK
jgi:hypothetical protein